MRKFIAVTAAVIALLVSGCQFVEYGGHLPSEIVCETQRGNYIFPVETNSIVVFDDDGFTIQLHDSHGDIEYEQDVFFPYGAKCFYAVD
tara:strand:- start:1028 stop:1294 length:267 start_codon:yes stop_codon:yes gene_type:complete